MEDVGASRNSGFTSKALGKKENIIQELLDETDKLSEAFENFPDKDAASTALYADLAEKGYGEFAQLFELD